MRDLRGDCAESFSLGTSSAMLCNGDAFLFQEQASASSLAAAIVWARRNSALRAVVFADRGASLIARLSRYFQPQIEVREVTGATSIVAEPEPLPVVLPGPDGADELLGLLRSEGLEPVLEQGCWRGELLGLEVARLVVWPEETGGDGELHLEAGVGRFDRDAVAALHGDEPPLRTLRRAVRTVGERRHFGAAPHPLSRMARARWLRAVATADPALVGARELTAVPTTVIRTGVADDTPAAAIGTTDDEADENVVVVFATGGALDLVPVAADTRALHAPEAALRLVVPTNDLHRATEHLAALLTKPAELRTMDAQWEPSDG